MGTWESPQVSCASCLRAPESSNAGEKSPALYRYKPPIIAISGIVKYLISRGNVRLFSKNEALIEINSIANPKKKRKTRGGGGSLYNGDGNGYSPQLKTLPKPPPFTPNSPYKPLSLPPLTDPLFSAIFIIASRVALTKGIPLPKGNQPDLDLNRLNHANYLQLEVIKHHFALGLIECLEPDLATSLAPPIQSRLAILTKQLAKLITR